jgi:tetratricopeptide (TPR) repeat protein
MQKNSNEALVLANSYLDDVTGLVHPISEISSEKASAILKTLKLANKQLDKAEQENRDARVSVKTTEGDEKEFSIPILRATSLMYEGLANGFGLGKKTAAVNLIERSLALVDNLPNAHYVLGLIYADLGQKAKALSALQRAAQLDPNNQEYRKTVDELEDMSTARLKLGAFQGSWKVMGALSGLTIIGVVSSLYQGQINVAVAFLVIFGVPAGMYWWWKSR